MRRTVRIRSVLFEFDGTLAVPGAIDFKTIKRDLGCPLDRTHLKHIEKQPAEKRVFLKELLEIHEEAVDILFYNGRHITPHVTGELKAFVCPWGHYSKRPTRHLASAGEGGAKDVQACRSKNRGDRPAADYDRCRFLKRQASILQTKFTVTY